MMTREEAAKWLEETIQDTDTYFSSCSEALQKELDEQKEVFLLALSALRPVSREQVEKMKKAPVEGEYDELYAPTYKCPECGFWNTGRGNFCRNCGCLHTDKAVEIMMERLEALKDGKGDND